MIPPLEETFAGNVWRVQACEGGYAVLATAPTSFGAEVEICRVAYLPHALAIAALPEIAIAIAAGRGVTLAVGSVLAVGDKCDTAINKAEGRHLFTEKD